MSTIVGVPRVPAGMLERDRLRELVGRAPLTVIRAPGGSGKTVLMAQWAARHAGAGAWITVEADAGSRLAFWNHVGEALAHHGYGLELPQDDDPDRDLLRRTLVRSFRSVDIPFVLIIDDAHELEDPLVVEDLLALLRSCRMVTAVVGTRGHSELEAPHEALTLDIATIEPESLLLTADEIEQIVGGDRSRFGATERLLEASGGSPLLLRAVLAGSAVERGSTQDAIAHYLRELFSVRAELEVFAPITAVPDDFDVEFACRLSSVPEDHVSTLLDWMESEGLVMRRGAAGVARYRYHPLVREVLRDELRRHSSDRFRVASLLASAEAETRRLYISALRHAVDAEDYLRASDVCLHGGFSLLRARGASTILESVPLRYVARLPFVAVVLGLAANARGDRLRALELLTLALAASRTRRRTQRPAEQAGLALIESVVLRITGRAIDAVAPARRMIAILQDASAEDLEEISDQLDSYWYQAALSLFRGGRLTEARTVAERVGISAEALAGGSPAVFGAGALAAVIDAALGDSRSAQELLARLDAVDRPATVRDGYVGSLAHLTKGVLALEANDVAAAKKALDVFGDHPTLEHGPLFTAFGGVVALWDGEPELGLRVIHRGDSRDRPRGRVTAQDRQVTAMVRSLLLAALGQLAPAAAAAQGLDRSHPLRAICAATVLVLEQRPADALGRLTAQLEWPGPRLQAAAELLTSCAWLMRDDRDVAAAALRRFLATSAVHRTITPFALVPLELRDPLLDLSRGVGAQPAVVEELGRVPVLFRFVPARPALTRREAEVLEELRTTTSFSAIAHALSVSTNTVKSQVRTLYRKLGASNRDEALRAAYLRGLLDE